MVGPLVYSLALGMSVSDVSGKAIANLATEELKHPAPVFHGDTLFCESEVLEKRESQSKPDRGTVKVHTRVLNQDGVLVAEFKRLVLVPRRSPGPEPRRGQRRLPARRAPTSTGRSAAREPCGRLSRIARRGRFSCSRRHRGTGTRAVQARSTTATRGSRIDAMNTTVPAPTKNERLLAWVEEVAALTEPDEIHWCDGSAEEYERLCQELVEAGTFERLSDAKRPNSYLALLGSRRRGARGGPHVHLLGHRGGSRPDQQLARARRRCARR